MHGYLMLSWDDLGQKFSWDKIQYWVTQALIIILDYVLHTPLSLNCKFITPLHTNHNPKNKLYIALFFTISFRQTYNLTSNTQKEPQIPHTTLLRHILPLIQTSDISENR